MTGDSRLAWVWAFGFPSPGGKRTGPDEARVRAKTLRLAEAQLSGRRKPVPEAPLSSSGVPGAGESRGGNSQPRYRRTPDAGLSYPPLPLPAGARSGSARAVATSTAAKRARETRWG